MEVKSKSVWGRQSFGGYAGLKFTASIIADYIPNCKIYVEPFAGLARVGLYVKADKKIYNDMSDYANNHNKRFNAVITKEDFTLCINRWDSEDTFFLLDPPWSDAVYEANEKTYIDRYYRDYYFQLFKLFPNLKGDWILTIDHRNYDRFIKKMNPYPNMEITSRKKSLFGMKSHITLISNKPFKHYQQSVLH